MGFFKKLHPVFQFIIIGVLLVLYTYVWVQFRAKIIPSVLMLLIAIALGASITTHFENQLQYNLEDKEEDALNKVEKYAAQDAKTAIAKLRAAAALGRKS